MPFSAELKSPASHKSFFSNILGVAQVVPFPNSRHRTSRSLPNFPASHSRFFHATYYFFPCFVKYRRCYLLHDVLATVLWLGRNRLCHFSRYTIVVSFPCIHLPLFSGLEIKLAFPFVYFPCFCVPRLCGFSMGFGRVFASHCNEAWPLMYFHCFICSIMGFATV